MLLSSNIHVPRRVIPLATPPTRTRFRSDPPRIWPRSNQAIGTSQRIVAHVQSYLTATSPSQDSQRPFKNAREQVLNNVPCPRFKSDACVSEASETDASTLSSCAEWLYSSSDQAKTSTPNSILSPAAAAEALKNITRVLETTHADSLLTDLWPLLRERGITSALSTTTFIEILRRLDPNDEFLPFRTEYSKRIPKHYRQLRNDINRHLRGLQQRRNQLAEICRHRVKGGRVLSLSEYRQILRCARATYDGQTASMVMDAMMSRNIRPDYVCYQAFFEAKCWSDTWHPLERQRLRVIPPNLKQRLDRPEVPVSKGVSLHPFLVGSKGLKSEVITIFNHMLEEGTEADRKIFGHLMTALAREGDIDGVKATLKSAWNIDLNASDVEEGYHPRMRRDSPLYPDSDTLFVIAHAFGANNDFPTALKAVDLMSRNFDIPITSAVWTELLEWACVLSLPRSAEGKDQGYTSGKLPDKTPENVWNLLTGEPYNIIPTPTMYDLMIRHYQQRRMLKHVLHYIAECMEKHCEQEATNAYGFRNGASQSQEPSMFKRGPVSSTEFTFFVYVNQWFKLLLAGRRWFQPIDNQLLRWQRQLLPDVISAFWRYRDLTGVQYHVDTGQVCLHENTNV